MIIEQFKILAKRKEELDWIVDNFMSSGEYTYFVGEAGVGKSILMIQLVDALQAGKTFLGMKCKTRNCLYIQVDTGRLEWRKQVSTIAGESTAWTAYALKDNFLDIPGEVENIRKILWADYTENTRLYDIFKGQPFNFLVIDVLNQITSREINSKEGANHVLNSLKRLTKRGEKEEEENIHFVLVHHPRKGERKGITAGAGSGVFAGSATQVLTLSKSDPTSRVGLLILEKSKVRSRKELLLEQDSVGAWCLFQDYSRGDFTYEKASLEPSRRNGSSRGLSEQEIQSILGD